MPVSHYDEDYDSYTNDEPDPEPTVPERAKSGRITRRAFPNDAIRDYCTRHLFSPGVEGVVATNAEWHPIHNWELKDTNYSKIGAGASSGDPVLDEITKIHGLIEVQVYTSAFSIGLGSGGYSVKICKADSYEWNEIEPQVFALLEERDAKLQQELGY